MKRLLLALAAVLASQSAIAQSVRPDAATGPDQTAPAAGAIVIDKPVQQKNDPDSAGTVDRDRPASGATGASGTIGRSLPGAGDADARRPRDDERCTALPPDRRGECLRDARNGRDAGTRRD